MCVCFEHKEQINSLLSELETVQLMEDQNDSTFQIKDWLLKIWNIKRVWPLFRCIFQACYEFHVCQLV